MIEELKRLLKQKKGNTYCAARLGILVSEVEKMREEIKQEKCSTNCTCTKEVNNKTGELSSTITSLDFEPKSDEELAELHKVDLTKYVISHYYSKLQTSGKFTSTVKANLKKASDYTPEDFAKFLESYQPKVGIPQTPIDSSKEIVDVELSIADFHLAKKTLQVETLEQKVEDYLRITKDLISKVSNSYSIGTVVFPISNDFFHTDNYQNQTTNGTPQDVLTSYDHEYELGFDLLVQVINYLQAIAQEVHVVLVQGNHDRTKSFYLAHALEIYFKNARVTFQREHSVTKAVLIGATFIGYHHGNCKIDQLPLLFATGPASAEFGSAKYREVHTGDKHHYMAKEVMGVRIQQMPSLSGTDRWHEDNNFVNSVRAGIATVYDFTKGRIAEFESRI